MKDVLGLKKVLSRPDQDKNKAASQPIQTQEPRRGSLGGILFGSKTADADKSRRSSAATTSSGPSGAAYASLHASDRDPAFLPAYRRPSAAEMESKNGAIMSDMM